MHPVAALRYNLDDRYTTHAERIGHQRTVASPRHRFGAHDPNAPSAAHANERRERVLKLLGLHIIAKAAKTFVSPAGVRRILARVPQTAQCFEMHIFEMMRFEALGQRGLVELRIMTRARDRTDVDETLDAIDLQHRHKRLDWQCGVPECEDRAVRPMRFLRWRMFAHDGFSERAGCRINTIGLPASTYPLHSAWCQELQEG